VEEEKELANFSLLYEKNEKENEIPEDYNFFL
jgi:hypothetical protein